MKTAPRELEELVGETTGGVDGLLLAPVGERGPWGAVRALRKAMRELCRLGKARATFLLALDHLGEAVTANDQTVEVFVLGYRLSPATADGARLQGGVLVLP